MEIGIIGAGSIGQALAGHCARLGHRVAIANSRAPETLEQIAAKLGVTARTAAEAATASDVVILAIPMQAYLGLPHALFDATPACAAIVDTANYYPDHRDGVIDSLEHGAIESEWVQDRLGRPVVKAFNNIGAPSLATRARPRGASDRIALSAAGDQPEAKQRILDLIDAIGFDPVDTGSLTDSWRQQPGTPAYCHDWNAFRMRAALAAANFDHRAFYRSESGALVREMHRLARAAKAGGVDPYLN